MSRKFLLIQLVIIFTLSTSFVYAATDYDTSHAVSVTLNVGEVFGFRITDDNELDQTLDFTDTDISNDSGNIHMEVMANSNTAWVLSAASDGLQHSQSGYGIPFLMSTLTGGGSTVSDKQLYSRSGWIYRSARGEENVNNLLVHATFTIPTASLDLSPSGTYSGQIVLEMIPLQ